MATRIPSKTEPPKFLLDTIREGAEFTLYRAREHGNSSPVLVVAPTAEQPLPQSLRRLEHEYSVGSCHYSLTKCQVVSLRNAVIVDASAEVLAPRSFS